MIEDIGIKLKLKTRVARQVPFLLTLGRANISCSRVSMLRLLLYNLYVHLKTTDFFIKQRYCTNASAVIRK